MAAAPQAVVKIRVNNAHVEPIIFFMVSKIDFEVVEMAVWFGKANQPFDLFKPVNWLE